MKIPLQLAVLFLVILFVSCNESSKSTDVETEADPGLVQETVSHEGFDSYGKEISPDLSLNLMNVRSDFEDLKVGDSLQMKVLAEVNEVCQAKGCWMTLDMARGEELMVKFKDYGFFVPKDIAGKDVIVYGKAFVEKMSVEDQKHYAMDEGKSEEEIAAITAPKKTFSFLADGVLVKSE